jgi:hypothetical protein
VEAFDDDSDDHAVGVLPAGAPLQVVVAASLRGDSPPENQRRPILESSASTESDASRAVRSAPVTGPERPRDAAKCGGTAGTPPARTCRATRT